MPKRVLIMLKLCSRNIGLQYTIELCKIQTSEYCWWQQQIVMQATPFAEGVACMKWQTTAKLRLSAHWCKLLITGFAVGWGRTLIVKSATSWLISLQEHEVKSFYYALKFTYYALGLKATNYDIGIMYICLGFMPSLLHVLAVSNSTSSMFTLCRVWEIWSQNYQCVRTQANTWARSSKFNVDVTILQHILMNDNPCCVLWYKFHVHK